MIRAAYALKKSEHLHAVIIHCAQCSTIYQGKQSVNLRSIYCIYMLFILHAMFSSYVLNQNLNFLVTQTWNELRSNPSNVCISAQYQDLCIVCSVSSYKFCQTNENTNKQRQMYRYISLKCKPEEGKCNSFKSHLLPFSSPHLF